MINTDKNIEINKSLSNLYFNYTSEMLSVYKSCFDDINIPCRINEFGIIDIERYNTDNGILVIGKETNGWNNKDFENGLLFRNWLNDISKNGLENKGHTSKHPNMWYNIGRWLLAINEQYRNIEEIAELKQEVIPCLGTMAYTNLNKVRGKGQSGTEYEKIAYSGITGLILRKEISIIKPKIIICCGTYRPFCYHINNTEFANQKYKILCMPHPTSCRNKVEMLKDLRSQLKRYE